MLAVRPEAPVSVMRSSAGGSSLDSQIFVVTLIMRIEFDEAKRAETIKARGLDMARTADVFAGATLTVEDDRQDYGEVRYLTIGLSGRSDGGTRLDAPRRRTQDHQHEEGQ